MADRWPPARSQRLSRTPLGARRAAVAAAALPFLFLHVEYQPSVSIAVRRDDRRRRASPTSPSPWSSAPRSPTGAPGGFEVLRAGRWVWAAAAGLALWVVAGALYGPLVLDDYPFAENLVTAAKFVEYALLAPAAALLVRHARGPARVRGDARRLERARDRGRAAAARRPRPLRHERSRRASARSSATTTSPRLSGATLLLGLAALVLEDRRARGSRSSAGAVGLILAAPLAGVLGLVLGVARPARARPAPRTRTRRGARSRPSRSSSSSPSARSRCAPRRSRTSSASSATDEDTTQIESYSQRTLLLYIGGRIFLDHPLIGVGLRGSEEPAAFEPYLEDARNRFPTAAEAAFPSTQNKWGVQSLYVQTLADLGVVGGALLLALLAAALALARRATTTAQGVIGLVWLLLVRRALGRAGARRGRAARRAHVVRGRLPRLRLGRPRRRGRERRGQAHAEPHARRRTPCARRSSRWLRDEAERTAGSAAASASSTSAAARSRTSPSSRPARPSTSASTSAGSDLVGTVEDLPVEDGSYDLVLCNQVLEHCADPAAGRPRAAPRHRARRPRARLDARRPGLPPGARRPVALDAHRPRAPVPRQRRLERRDASSPAPGPPPASACSSARTCTCSRNDSARRPLAKPAIAVLNAGAEALDRRVPLAARAAAGRDLRQLPRRRGGRVMARKVLVTGGGGLHRLEPRPRRCSSAATRSACSTTSPPAAGRTSTTSRTTSRSSRASCAATSASTTPSAGSRSSSTSARSARCRARCRTR